MAFCRYIEVKGNAYERGQQIGKALGDRVLANYNNLVSHYKGLGSDYADWEGMVEGRYVDIMKQWTPEVLDELRGVADGSGLPFSTVLATTCYYERSFDVDSVEAADKCTSFLATGKATKDGSTIIAQTNDEDLNEMLWELDVTIHHVDPETGYESLIYTHPGIPAMMGMNNRGVAVTWTYIDNGKIGHGVPTTVIIRHLLELGSTQEAIDYCREVPHDIPNEFGVGDSKGNIACIECFPNVVNVGTDDTYLVHTNHNLFSPDEPECSVSATTHNRLENITKLVKENLGKIDVEVAEGFFRFHDEENPRGNICVHPRGEAPWRISMASMVYDLTHGEMHIAHGPACEHPYRDYKFDSYMG